MKRIALFAILTLTASCACSQTSFPALTVLDGDTVVCLQPLQLKTLNSQIALLVEHHNSCTATVRKADELLSFYKENEADLREIIANSNMIIENQNVQIANLSEMNRNTKRVWFRRMLYGTCGGLVVGVVAGVLVR